MDPARRIRIEPSPKHVRAMANGRTVADSLAALLLLESGHRPVYYFPRADVRTELLVPSNHRTHCPYKGGDHAVENAAWSYETPIDDVAAIKSRLAFYWDRLDRWFEEDEEIFGHPRDPYHRVDVRPSSRVVRVVVGGETIAHTRRAMFLFETGLPTRYYIPPDDLRMEFLEPSRKVTTCPYKGNASYWSVRVGARVIEDAAWAYMEPLPDCPRIKAHVAFYPEKVDQLEVEGGAATS